MFSARSKKVIRDLLLEKRRTFTVLLAMIIGVFAVAMMTSSKSLLDKNLTENFLRTNPASFSFSVDNISSEQLNDLTKLAEIKELTTRRSIWIRMKKADGTFLPVLLYVLEDVTSPRINTYNIDEGSFPINSNEIVLERTGKKLETLFVDQNIELHFPGLTISDYKISGFTHDAGIAPSWMEGYLYGYISAKELSNEYLANYPTEIKFTVSNKPMDLFHITEVARNTKEVLEQMQVEVISSEIHEPGVHMHQKQMNALMFLILNFGVLALVLSCFLIINMISALMAKEVKQIAIMKATGASSIQIAGIYLTTIVAMSLVSIIIGTPIGLLAGKVFATFNASMLNFELFDKSISLAVLLIIGLTGTILPLLISLSTIMRSSRISVQKSLNDVGIENNAEQSQLLLLSSRVFTGSYMLALRNAFRRKARLALTVVSLAIGGAIFISSFNIRQSTNNAIDNNFDSQPQDIMYQLLMPIESKVLDSLFATKDYNYELAYRTRGRFLRNDGLYSNSFLVSAFDVSSSLYSPVISKGRWVEPNKKEIVINQVLKKDNGKVDIGDKVNLSIKGKTETYTIVGVSQEMFMPPGLLMGAKSLAKHLDFSSNTGNFILIDVPSNNQKEIAKANLQIEQVLKAQQINVVNSITKESYKKAVVEHLVIILLMLLSMTVLVVIVGGLGMATSININISERKRELGILRAIGIQKHDLRNMVLTESLSMGGISWLIAIILAMPLSLLLGNEFFTIFFESSMGMSISITGIILWVIVTILICSISSLTPAKRLIRGNIPSNLNYE